MLSDWNHGNAHFLRGITAELLDRGHDVRVFEPADGWSRENLVADHGTNAIDDVQDAFPRLTSSTYDAADYNVAAMTEGADVVLVHEWNTPQLVAEVGRCRQTNGYRALFHDTHHRAVSAPEQMSRYDLRHYDGVLAFGRILRDLYLERGWTARAWTWHEAADTRVFHPVPGVRRRGDLVWIGNWGDGERTATLYEFVVEPVAELELAAQTYGVRYPDDALCALAQAGIAHGGWLPNHRVPEVFAAHAVTVHVPRGPYLRALPGIPTIRPFEALACGIPLVSTPWDDVEGLFTEGSDYLVARHGRQMTRHLTDVLHDRDLRNSLRAHGLETIRARHTCSHRVDELLEISAELGVDSQKPHERIA